MATIYLLDLTAPRSDEAIPPLGWQCAAEMVECSSLPVAAELWRSCRVPRSDACANSFALTSFPLPIRAVNRYFTTSVTAVVGCAPPRKVSTSETQPHEEELQAGIASALQPRLLSSAPSTAPRAPYGCVFLVNEEQSPSVVPWHLLPPSTSLFNAVLVVVASVAGEARQGEMWRAACAHHQFEFIPSGPTCRGSAALAPVAAEAVAKEGLLGKTLEGSARVLQILCNTIWPPEVRQSRNPVAARPSTTKTTLSPVSEAGDEGPRRKENALLVVGGGSATYLRMLLWRSFTLPGWRLPHEYAAGGNTVDATAAMQEQDVRFFSYIVPAAAVSANHAEGNNVHPLSGCGAAACAEEEDVPCHGMFPPPPPSTADGGGGGVGEAAAMVLVNRYYTATIHPTFLHAAFFSPATLDLLRRRLEGLSPCARRHNGEAAAATAAVVPVVLFWPPNGGQPERNGENSSDGFPYPPLSTIVHTLREMPGFGDILVVTGARVGRFVVDAGKGGTVDEKEFKHLYASDRLDAIEAQQCAALPDVEIVSLLPLTGVQTARTPSENGNRRKGSLVYRRPPQETEEATAAVADEEDCGWSQDGVQGPLGGDRLREFLHSQDWPVRTPTDRPPPTRHRQPKNGANMCRFAVYGSCAEEEEQWMRHILSHAFPTTGATTGQGDGGRRTITEACLGIPSLHLDDLAIPVANKYFTSLVHLTMPVGGVRDRLWRRRRRETSSEEEEEGEWDGEGPLPAGAAVVVAVCSRATLEGCARGDPAWSALAKLLRAAQHRLSQDLDRDIERVAEDCWGKAGTHGADEFLFLLYIVDLDDDDDAGDDGEALADVMSHLRAILTGGNTHAEGGSSSADGEGQDTAVVPLIEVVAADRRRGRGGRGGRGPEVLSAAAPLDTSGCARLAEALAQYPWRERTERFVQGVPRPMLPQRGDSAGETPEGASAEPPSHDSARPLAEGGGGEQAPLVAPEGVEAIGPATVGCALPEHFLVDPITLRSEAVPALLYFQHKTSSEDEADQRNERREQRYRDDVMAWVDKMKVHGHKLPRDVRRQQAAILSLLMEHIL